MRDTATGQSHGPSLLHGQIIVSSESQRLLQMSAVAPLSGKRTRQVSMDDVVVVMVSGASVVLVGGESPHHSKSLIPRHTSLATG